MLAGGGRGMPQMGRGGRGAGRGPAAGPLPSMASPAVIHRSILHASTAHGVLRSTRLRPISTLTTTIGTKQALPCAATRHGSKAWTHRKRADASRARTNKSRSQRKVTRHACRAQGMGRRKQEAALLAAPLPQLTVDPAVQAPLTPTDVAEVAVAAGLRWRSRSLLTCQYLRHSAAAIGVQMLCSSCSRWSAGRRSGERHTLPKQIWQSRPRRRPGLRRPHIASL